ncbi:unnamed protein product [Ixodes persulcatus]
MCPKALSQSSDLICSAEIYTISVEIYECMQYPKLTGMQCLTIDSNVPVHFFIPLPRGACAKAVVNKPKDDCINRVAGSGLLHYLLLRTVSCISSMVATLIFYG